MRASIQREGFRLALCENEQKGLLMNNTTVRMNRIGLGRPPVVLHEPTLFDTVFRRSAHQFNGDAHMSFVAKRGEKQSFIDLTELALISTALSVAGFAALWAMSL